MRILIEKEIKSHGKKCSLNNIDISKVTDLSYIFCNSKFNGDISLWDTSNVTDMNCLFMNSQFNGDISKWDLSKVISMADMFSYSQFNGDISSWIVSKVKHMNALFCQSKFTGDVSNWKPFNLETINKAFADCSAPQPYWSFCEGNKNIRKAIDCYIFAYDLINKLDKKDKKSHEIKI